MIAVDLIKESFEKTKKLLLPFSFVIWLKLAVLVLFIGTNGVNINYKMPGAQFWEFLKVYWAFIGVFILIGLLIALLFLFLRSVFLFCFIDSILKKVKVFGYFSKNIKKGFS